MENLAFFTHSLKKSKLRFTLVELIIVITILAILRTIGFMSFSSYVSDARDTARVVTIKSIQSGIDMYSTLKSSLPSPDNALTLSGGTGVYIKQGIIGKSVSSTIKLTNDVKDPKTNKEYIYSISGNGNYYQIGADLENVISYNNFANTAYAEQTKAYVKGNYSFDPSLPSLITITGSVNTNSGIFDPNVCFVIDGGTNLVSSTSTNCTEKYKMSLKDYDSSLVGYWDMESIIGGLLKDLSGNENNGVFSGNISPSSTGGYLGKGLLFSSGFIDIPDYSTKGIKIDKQATFSFLFNKFNNNSVGTILGKRLLSNNVDYIIYITAPSKLIFHGTNELGLWWNAVSSIDGVINNSYLLGNIRFDNGYTTYFINGKKIFTDIEYSGTGGILSTSSGSLQIGAKMSSTIFNGIIDDVKIYNRALSDSEIAQQAKIAGF